MAAQTMPQALRRADLAARSRCNIETIRYYEKIGVLPDPPRTPSGYRLYDESHLARLRFILRAREQRPISRRKFQISVTHGSLVLVGFE